MIPKMQCDAKVIRELPSVAFTKLPKSPRLFWEPLMLRGDERTKEQ